MGFVVHRLRIGNKVLFVNQGPGKNSKTLAPITEGAGRRLCKLMSIGYTVYTWKSDRINLVAHYHEKYPMGAATNSAAKIFEEIIPEYNEVIIIGRKAWKAFGFDDIKYFAERRETVCNKAGDWKQVSLYLVPTLDKRYHWWNDPRHVASAERFFQSIGKVIEM